MKRGLLLLLSCCLVGGCSLDAVSEEETPPTLMQYRVDSDHFAIIRVKNDGVSTEEAKKQAVAEAAKVAVQNGYRYFVIESEQDVIVVPSSDVSSDKPNLPSNMYQELIVEGNFGKDNYDPLLSNPQTYTAYHALKIIIHGINEGSQKGSIDACALTPCSSK